jgi:hypothetical protein
MTTKDKIEETITKGMEDLELPNLVADTLSKFEGKKPSKRMATALEKATGMRVHYEASGLFNGQLSLWKTHYKDRIIFYLDKGPLFSLDKFKATNARYFSAAVERNEQRRELLGSEEYLYMLAELIDIYNIAHNNLKEMLEIDNPDVHEIKDLIKRDL